MRENDKHFWEPFSKNSPPPFFSLFLSASSKKPFGFLCFFLARPWLAVRLLFHLSQTWASICNSLCNFHTSLCRVVTCLIWNVILKNTSVLYVKTLSVLCWRDGRYPTCLHPNFITPTCCLLILPNDITKTEMLVQFHGWPVVDELSYVFWGRVGLMWAEKNLWLLSFETFHLLSGSALQHKPLPCVINPYILPSLRSSLTHIDSY